MLNFYIYNGGKIAGVVSSKQYIPLLAACNSMDKYSVYETEYSFTPSQVGKGRPFLLLPSGEVIKNPNYESEKHQKDVEARASTIHAARDSMIADTEWVFARAASEKRMARTLTVSDADLMAIDVWHQHLRDLPAQEGFPWLDADIPWPTIPACFTGKQLDHIKALEASCIPLPKPVFPEPEPETEPEPIPEMPMFADKDGNLYPFPVDENGNPLGPDGRSEHKEYVSSIPPLVRTIK